MNSRTTVMRYLDGSRRPSDAVMRTLTQLSGGQVTPEDFDDPSPPACAVEVTDRGRTVLVYPWTCSERLMDKAFRTMLDEPTDGAGTPPPIERAMTALGDRATPTKRGQYLLDGRVVDARGLVRAANGVLDVQGQPPIAYPGVSHATPTGEKR